jgi:tetratricopeptide (TPR) repeat protein
VKPHMRIFSTFVVALALLSSARSAVAASADDQREARRNFQAGEVHFKAGRYTEALEAYQAGYAAAPLPGFLINVAQCQRRLGDLAKAHATYEKFLFVAPDSPLVPEVKKLLAELDQMLAAEAETDTPAPPELSAPAPAEPAPTTAAAATLTAEARPAPAPAPPQWKRWWVWGAVGAALAAGTVTAFALSSSDPTMVHDGSLGTLRR